MVEAVDAEHSLHGKHANLPLFRTVASTYKDGSSAADTVLDQGHRRPIRPNYACPVQGADNFGIIAAKGPVSACEERDRRPQPL